MTKYLALVAARLSLTLTAARAGDFKQDWDRCNNGNDTPEDSIAACTAALQSGRLSTDDQSAAYDNRGIAYDGLGQYAHAIKDFDEAIRLKPDHADDFSNRGAAYDKLGQHAQAQVDYAETCALDSRHCNNTSEAK